MFTDVSIFNSKEIVVLGLKGLGKFLNSRSAACEGLRCAGNDLTVNGLYNSSETSYLLSPPIDCRNLLDAQFSFWRYLNVENNYDEVYLDITTDGTNWVGLNHPLYVQENTWTEVSYDISTQAVGNVIQIRWRLASDGSVQHSGWNFDNVFVTGTAISAPENLVINIDASGNVVLTWDAVAGATSYKVFSSSSPDGDFTEETGGIFNGTSWSDTVSDQKKFYYVTAVN